MSLDADLATLRELVALLESEGLAQAADNLRDATDGVGAEIARLRDGLRRTQEVLTAAETIVGRKRFDLDPEVRSLRISIRDARHRALLAEDGAA